MCGIAGIVDRAGVTVPEVVRMTKAMERRGPDGEGVWCDGMVGLGHRRLAIIDLSDRGAQPMARYGGTLQIVFNGEIYNFHELRAELERSGEQFVSHSDTEVLLAGFRQWGDAMWARLRGMFAIAIWDANAQTLTLARDPLGKKPLFWTRRGERIAFASTLASLQLAFDRQFALNPAALNDYLANNVVSGNDTIYLDVHRVPPAHVCRFDRDLRLTRHRYWKLDFSSKQAMSFDDAWDQSSRLLDQAVARRLVSDVPLGAFLSGGFDSGLVVASMRRAQGAVRTFTVGTPGTQFDERGLAAEVAAKLNTQHTELALAPTTAQWLPRLLADVGQPFGDSSLLPSYEVARAARDAVTVVLTGDGGDEGFFGYTAFQGVLAADTLRRFVPLPAMWGFAGRLVGGEGRAVTWRRMGHVMRLAGGDLTETLYNPMGFRADARSRLLTPGVVRAVELDAPESAWRAAFEQAEGEDTTERFVSTFVERTLSETYLVKVDTATMATSLEARCPFLDADLLQFLATLPRRAKFPRGQRKHLLRPIVARDLPESILNQPKRGFSLPVDRWLRGPLVPAFERYVLTSRGAIADMIDPSSARALLDRHRSGENHQSRLWSLLALGVWSAVALDRSIDPDAPLEEAA